ncbi:c-type cytochrome [bacterium]|nr:c-type cytochrome [bacterium]MBU1989941.1 c-type cytochrome [bacterium]
MHIFIFILLGGLTLNALTSDTLREKALSKGLKPVPADYEKLRKMVDDPENPMSPAKIRLGKKLFFDKNLSKNRDIACAKCHDLDKGGEDSIPTAIGHEGRENPSHLNTPTILNTAFSKHLFWDARSPSLQDQAKGPMQASFEMASTPELIVERVRENPDYAPLFANAFGDTIQINFDNITKAIAAYEKILVTRADFDTFLEGDNDALTLQAQKGLELFIDLGCKGCHFGSAVGGQSIQQFPLRNYNSIIDLTSAYDDVNKKRHVTKISLNFKLYHPYPFENIGGFMGKDGAKKFRVPILRNITQGAPYFHNGIIKDLREAIFIMGRYQIGVDLNKRQIDAIEAFLQSLEGEVVDYDLDAL